MTVLWKKSHRVIEDWYPALPKPENFSDAEKYSHAQITRLTEPCLHNFYTFSHTTFIVITNTAPKPKGPEGPFVGTALH